MPRLAVGEKGAVHYGFASTIPSRSELDPQGCREIRMREHQHIEWKESWHDEYLKWICGFANAEGGVLVIGRNDKGTVTGLTHAKKLLEDIPNKVRDILGVMVDVNLREENAQEYLEMRRRSLPQSHQLQGDYVYRTGSTNQALKGKAHRSIPAAQAGTALGRRGPAPHFVVADLSPQALAAFARKKAAKSKRLSAELLAESDAVLLEKLKLFDWLT